jgi:hypothetical protein
MSEAWYAITGTGEACGPGTRLPLSQTIGSSPTTQDIVSEQTWNRAETARTIEAGTWAVAAWVTTGSGGGSPNRVTCVVERRNSSCVVQETLINVQSANLTANSTEQITFSASVGAVAFAAGNMLTVRFVRSQGARTAVLRFNGSAAGSADTRLEHPVELGEAGIEASLSVILDAVALSAAGSLGVTGALAQTLDDVSLSATGEQGDLDAIMGALSVTVDDVALVATGTPALSGASAQTLADATLRAEGSLTITGELSATLADTTLSADSTLSIAGAVVQTLAAVVVSTDGTPALSGVISAVPADAILDAAGSLAIGGALDIVLESARLTSTGVKTASPLLTVGVVTGSEQSSVVRSPGGIVGQVFAA